MKHPRHASAFTRVELIVAAIVLIALFAVVGTSLNSYLCSKLMADGFPAPLSNMKQLHLATQQMVLDGETTKDPTLSWPGDTGGTFTNWVRHLVPDYLTTNDFVKLLSAPGKITPPGKLPTKNDNGVLVYAVSSNSPGDTIFLSTANFINSPTGGALDPKAKPYGNKGFIIFHKAGDGAILLAKQATNRSLIGSYAPLCH